MGEQISIWKSITESRKPGNFSGLDLYKLKLDQCYLEVKSEVTSNAELNLYHRSSICHGCPYERIGPISGWSNSTLVYDSNPYWNFLVSSSDQQFVESPQADPNTHCSIDSVDFGEFGVYQLAVTDSKCSLVTLKQPVFKYAALFWALGFYIICGVVYVLVNRFRQYRRKNVLHIAVETEDGQPEKAQEGKHRLKSLDVFRGVTVALMILSHYGGGGYWFMKGAPWDGLPVADVLWPWFVWIMGVCIPLSISAQIKRGIPRVKILKKILVRSIILFILGIIRNSISGRNSLMAFRIPGILQRLSFGYLIGASVYCVTFLGIGGEKKKQSGKEIGKADYIGERRKKRSCGLASLYDIITLLPQYLFYALMAGGHTALILYLSVPGCPTGYIGPGGISLLQDGAPSPDCIGGVARYVDMLILGKDYIGRNKATNSVYQSSSFDHAGILGIFPTAVEVFLGIQAGQILVYHRGTKPRLFRFALWALVYMAAGLGLSGGTLLGGPLPVNKNLWSLSYVFVTSSMGLLLFMVFYLLVDHLKWLSGAPFYQAGMNSILLYVGERFTHKALPWHYTYPDMTTHLDLLPEALVGTTVWIIIAVVLHKKRIFLRI